MPHRIVTSLLILLALSPCAAFGQDATVIGMVVDDSKSVLPGATITATDLLTGREYVVVADVRGEYRLPSVAPGSYKVQAELAGFATTVVPSVELLVGQNAAIPFTLKLASLEASVTVSSQAPLVDLSSSAVAGNVDRQRMADLPLQGRNWMELAMMVKGITANNVDNQPGVSVDTRFQLNLDGQQVGRNALLGLPLDKVDLRLSQDISLGQRRKIQATLEVFNLFDHANYGTYVAAVDLATLGQPVQNLGNACLARAAQFGFRIGS
jgi:Carboxypeptidase regulatory-like domain